MSRLLDLVALAVVGVFLGGFFGVLLVELISAFGWTSIALFGAAVLLIWAVHRVTQ